MNMSKTLLTIVFILFGFIADAQDSQVLTGIVAFEGGDFKKALSLFNTALKEPSNLKAKNLPKAYYYRSKTWLNAIDQAVVAKDSDWLSANPKAIINAYEDCKQAEKADDGKWASNIKAQFVAIRQKLIQFGMVNLTTLQEAKEDAEKQQLYESTISYFKPALAIEEEYLIYDLMTQTEAAKEFASEQSLVYADKAILLYEKAKPETPDPYIGYVYYRKALVERYTKKDLEQAWGTLQKGMEMLDDENNRVLLNIADKEKGNSLLGKIKTARKDLERFELDILLNTPKLQAKAIEKFEAAIKNEPSDYLIRVAYASLLESTNIEKAIFVYQEAIAIDPTQEAAYYNLGALYNNEAAKYYNQANEEPNYTKAGELQKQVDAYFEGAYVQFQKAYELNPNQLTTINALIQISIRLGKLDDYKKYQAAKKKLQEGD